MRVITGTARGRKLNTLEGLDVRPTTDQVKEAMFSIIQFEVEGAAVLDLFAGSGQLGIEALSRGAQLAVFVEQSRKAQEVVRQNLLATKLAEHSRVTAMDAIAYLQGCRDHFDIALLDPPYRSGLLQKALPLLAPKMTPGGVILCESALDEELPQKVGAFKIKKQYRYGRIKLTAYRIPAETDTEE